MLTKKYYDGFIVHDILYKHLEPGKMMEVLTAFAEAKGVDAVEVVRCKDCKYFKKHTGKYLEQRFCKDGICRYHNYEETMAEEFCSKGIKE